MSNSQDARTIKEKLEQAKRDREMKTPKPNEPTQQQLADKKVKKPGENANLFSKVQNMTTPGKASPKDWSNEELAKIPIYSVSTLDVNEAVILGDQMMTMLLGNTATRDLIDILLFLAVSLRNPNRVADILLTAPSDNYGKKTVLSKPSVATSTVGTSERTDLDSTNEGRASDLATRLANAKKNRANAIITGASAGPQIQNIVGVSSENKAAIYSFVAAFLLRAHSRKPESLVESVPRMVERCASWYDGAEAVLENLIIEKTIVEGIKNLLARREEVMSTWVMWVAFNENESNLNKNSQGMMSYLAGQIYQYTGLHAVVQILAIQQVTQVRMDQLMGELNHRSTRQPLMALYDLLQNHELVKERPNRKTYFRYARIWDSGYFHELQSKQCPDLVYLAARILKDVSPTGARSDPTKIYAIQDLGEVKREFLDKVANNISRWLVQSDDDTGDSGASWSM